MNEVLDGVDKGNLKETIYMDCPEGMQHGNDKCLKLDKTIYGLVQSAREYNLKFIGVLKKMGFKQCEADPCLFMRGKGESLIIIM